MLLNTDVSKGKISFKDLKTVDGVEYDNFQAVCRAHGMLQDDNEWNAALEEASLVGMPAQCRLLFIIILLYCSPQNGLELFERWHVTWTDDLKRKAERAGFNNVTDQQLKIMVLLDLQERLESHGSSLLENHLPQLAADDLLQVKCVKINFKFR